MAEDTARHDAARAPYNFIPFSDKVLLPYDSPEQLPPHDRMAPGLKMGEIHVTMTADTPVFVGDGGRPPRFFRGSGGRYTLPGSTIRGMVRENMQILGFGLMRPDEDMKDVQIYFRDMASCAGDSDDPLKNYYRAALGIRMVPAQDGGLKAVPVAVKAGYVRRENGRYRLYPSKPPLTVRRDHPDVETLRAEARQAGGGIPRDNAWTEQVFYRAENGRVTRICGAYEEGTRRGTLMCTGRWVGKTANPLYLFPPADRDPLSLKEEDVLSYLEDLEKRSAALGRNRSFWELPREGREKPVFYVEYEGHIYLGMSRFPRIGYRYPLSRGLPESHRNAGDKVDLPYAILGFAHRDGAYRSRVSFGDFAAEGDGLRTQEASVVLMGPKPSYYPGYVEGGKHYNSESFRLRGYKQYWLKEAEPAGTGAPRAVSIRPLPRGTRFGGVIRYKNLTGEELGLLLWCLRLEDGCFQSVGMAKPYGYGRMRLTIQSVREFEPDTLYRGGSFQAPPWRDGTEKVGEYIDRYRAYARRQLDEPGPLEENDVLRDFFYMRSTIREKDETRYMELKDYSRRKTLPSVRNERKGK